METTAANPQENNCSVPVVETGILRVNRATRSFSPSTCLIVLQLLLAEFYDFLCHLMRHVQLSCSYKFLFGLRVHPDSSHVLNLLSVLTCFDSRAQMRVAVPP